MYSLITSIIMLIPAGNNEGRPTYHLIVNDKAYEYVYIEEVKEFYKTGKFEYNEDLGD